MIKSKVNKHLQSFYILCLIPTWEREVGNDCFYPYKRKIQKNLIEVKSVWWWGQRHSQAGEIKCICFHCCVHCMSDYRILSADYWKAIISVELPRSCWEMSLKTFFSTERSAINPPEPLHSLEALPKPSLNHYHFSSFRHKHRTFYFKPEKNDYNNSVGSDSL